MALFTSRSATITLRDPITSTALITLTTQLRNLDTGESPEYAERSYHRSGAVSSAKKRSKGSIAIDKTPDGMALVRELERWQKGVTYYALTSDLKGRTYRHPTLEISMTDAGTTEVITAYGVRLASRSFGLPLSGPASDSINLDVLRGFDLSASEAADNYEPKRALDLHRTGSKTYVNSAGTLSTVTDGQAAIGVPSGTYSATKAGLVLEGAGANLLTANQSDVETNTTGFTTSGIVTLTRVTTEKYQGAASLQVVTTGGGNLEGVITSVATAVQGTYSAQVQIKGASGGVRAWLRANYSDATTQDSDLAVTLNGAWQMASIPALTTNGAKTLTSLAIHVRTNGVQAITFYVDAQQIELSPFPTSWMQGGTTRAADLCGIVYPQNELIHSHDLTQSAWTKTGLTAAKSGSDNTLTLAATTDHAYQAVTPSSVPSTTRTAAARLKLGTLSGSVLLRLLDQSGNVIASTTISTATLSASEYRTCYVTGTAASDDTGLRVQIIGSSGTGTILVESVRLVQGSHPGIVVQTGDTAIPAPTSPALDPAWVQNGSLKVRVVPPSVSTGLSYGLVGAKGASFDTSALILWRFSGLGSGVGTVLFDRRHNGTSGYAGLAGRGSITGGSIYDGAAHDIELRWKNYTIAGVRYMPMELWIDSVLIGSADVATLYGATSWTTPDASTLISNGNTYSTLSAPSDGQMLSYPTLPAGAIPAV